MPRGEGAKGRAMRREMRLVPGRNYEPSVALALDMTRRKEKGEHDSRASEAEAVHGEGRDKGIRGRDMKGGGAGHERVMGGT